jgi:3-phenylpropionate/trans-cinnamate dioxygenase ferredoxin reductase component
VIYYRTLHDYRRLRALADGCALRRRPRIGSEIAATLKINVYSVSMVFPEPRIARIFPPDLSAFVTDYYRGKVIEARRRVGDRDRTKGECRAGLDQGRAHARSGRGRGRAGDRAGTELAAAAGLPVENRILVDEAGRVGRREHIFAAGDVARFPTAALGGAMRVEQEGHTKTHGRPVGKIMAGTEERFEHLPFFYSDLFDLAYDAVGELDARHESVADWEEPNRKGVVYYLDGLRHPRGVLLLNVFGYIDAARDLIRAQQPIEASSLRAGWMS